MIFPTKRDYPPQLFRNEFWTEGCGSAYFESNLIVKHLFKKRIDVVVKLIGNENYENSIDVGTGVGYLLPYLSKVSNKVVGIDVNYDLLDGVERMLQKYRIHNVFVVWDDIEKSNLTDSFDLVICLSNLEHIRNPDNACRNIRKMATKKIIFGFPIENRFISIMKSVERIMFRPLAQKQIKEGQRKGLFNHHISSYIQIESAIRKSFTILKTLDIKLFNIGLYRIIEAR